MILPLTWKLRTKNWEAESETRKVRVTGAMVLPCQPAPQGKGSLFKTVAAYALQVGGHLSAARALVTMGPNRYAPSSKKL